MGDGGNGRFIGGRGKFSTELREGRGKPPGGMKGEKGGVHTLSAFSFHSRNGLVFFTCEGVLEGVFQRGVKVKLGKWLE